MLFRAGGDRAPANLGNGFLIDNLTLMSGPTPVARTAAVHVQRRTTTTMTLVADCATTTPIVVPELAKTLEGNR